MTLYEFDEAQGYENLCGVDEAGRGPLAGDVYAAAVILKGKHIDGLNDSKKLTAKKRDELFDLIVANAVIGVGTSTVAEIEQLNILQATFLAMQRAVAGLKITPNIVLVDGNQNPHLPIHSRCIVKGDGTSACIAAASIIAKVLRDRYMCEMDKKYPEYGFSKHKGYGTQLHYQKLSEFSLCPIHRPSFLKKFFNPSITNKRKRGDLGENLAVEYLLCNNYTIVARNYYNEYGEIDIIAEKNDTIAFVEVKTRKDDSFTEAKSAVTQSKINKIIKTTMKYLQEYNSTKQPRFDVVEVYLTKDDIPIEINYLEAAFIMK